MSVKIVLLERNSAGTDISVDCFGELGEVTAYANTVTEAEVAERVGDADIIVCNKSPMREATLKNCPNVKLICDTLSDTSRLEEERQKYADEMTLVADMVQAAMLENARVALDQNEYRRKNDALAERFEEAKKKHDELVEQLSVI
jgi:phosphoglycerate dehydrogenase-like enzyme